MPWMRIFGLPLVLAGLLLGTGGCSDEAVIGITRPIGKTLPGVEINPDGESLLQVGSDGNREHPLLKAS